MSFEDRIKMLREKQAADIKFYGQTLVGVFPTDSDPIGTLPFAYTIGNRGHGLPELLMIGNVHFNTFSNILNALGEKMRERGRPFDDGELVDLGAPVPMKVIRANQTAIDDYATHVEYFYGPDYQVMQVLIPDPEGRYPGDKDCEEPYNEVPVLRHVVH